VGTAGIADWTTAIRWPHRAVLNEIKLSFLFICNDIWTTVIPASAFVLAAARHDGASWGTVLTAFGKGALYFWLFIYGFTLTNQLFGIEEDRLNKPRRPLVTGACGVRGAQVRTVLALVAFPLVGWWFGVLLWALVWEVVYLLNNVARWERHWFFKDLFIGIGVVAQLAAAWLIVAPLTPLGWRWIGTLAVAVLLLIPIQDLRDVDGDRAIGRRTLVIAFGQRFTRGYLAAGFLCLPIATHFLLMAPSDSPLAPVFDALLAASSWWIAVRVLTRRSRKEDRRSQRRFEQ
jgi:4-hydroxybenzoate polyprenyltransferase